MCVTKTRRHETVNISRASVSFSIGDALIDALTVATRCYLDADVPAYKTILKI